MKLNPQQKAVYEYLRDHGEATIVELRNALFISKPCMRISEINRMYQKEHDEPLIITVRKKSNGEHVKGLTRKLPQTIREIVVRDGRAVEVVRTVSS